MKNTLESWLLNFEEIGPKVDSSTFWDLHFKIIEKGYFEDIKYNNDIDDLSAGKIVFSSDPQENRNLFDKYVHKTKESLVKNDKDKLKSIDGLVINAIHSYSTSEPLQRALQGEQTLYNQLNSALETVSDKPLKQRLDYLGKRGFGTLLNDLVGIREFERLDPNREQDFIDNLYEGAQIIDNALKTYDLTSKDSN